jgi:hypothetical protein
VPAWQAQDLELKPQYYQKKILNSRFHIILFVLVFHCHLTVFLCVFSKIPTVILTCSLWVGGGPKFIVLTISHVTQPP